jgi:hypothetical protein
MIKKGLEKDEESKQKKLLNHEDYYMNEST